MLDVSIDMCGPLHEVSTSLTTMRPSLPVLPKTSTASCGLSGCAADAATPLALLLPMPCCDRVPAHTSAPIATPAAHGHTVVMSPFGE